MKNLVILLIFTSLYLSGHSQSYYTNTFEISRVIASEDSNRIFLLFKGFAIDGRPLFGLDPKVTDFEVTMSSSVQSELNLSIEDISTFDSEYDSQVIPLKVLFLLDLSGSMRGEKLRQAKQAIKNVVERDVLKKASIEFAYFHDEVSESQKLNKYNYAARVDPVDVGPEGKGKDTDLYRAILEKSKELESFNGKKVLVVLTDGKNDIERNPRYRGSGAKIPVQSEEVYTYISSLDSTFQIFPVGLGSEANEFFLQTLAQRSVNEQDSYSFGLAPQEITSTFISIAKDVSSPNYRAKILPSQADALFGSEDRVFTLKGKDSKGDFVYETKRTAVLGSSVDMTDLRLNSKAENDFWQILILLLIILGALLAVLAYSVPQLLQRTFRKKYIKTYKEVKLPNRQKTDPLQLRPIEDNEQVVLNEKGDVITLTTWKYWLNKQEQAIDFQSFFEHYPKGGNFFDQAGIYRQLNWLWFGAAGGAIAWLTSSLLNLFDWSAFENILFEAMDSNNQVSGAIVKESLVGIGIGFGIVSMLALVEEKGQTRKFNLGRVLLRTLLGTIAGFFIFFLISTITTSFIPITYFRSLICWTLFGICIAGIVSLLSSIEYMSAVKGGIIAAVIAFHVYYLVNHSLFNHILPEEFARAISYLLYGGLLGYFINFVVTRLESFELRCISPTNFSGWQSPISKWLKSTSIDHIYIGKHPKNNVYIKWEDNEIKARHAKLTLEKYGPAIAPQEGDVEINNKKINKLTPLSDGDRIKLSQKSVLQFISKEESSQNPNSDISGGSPSGIKVKKRSEVEKASIRKKIIINKR